MFDHLSALIAYLFFFLSFFYLFYLFAHVEIDIEPSKCAVKVN